MELGISIKLAAIPHLNNKFIFIGPCNVIGGNETAYNAFAWNTKANVFFIDQPVGTGFSYSDLGERVVCVFI